jgi:hypothetical protein
MNPRTTPPDRIRFFESGSPDAAAVLAGLAEQLRAQGAEVERLTSSDQPGLYLLVARGGDGELACPPAVRQWRFVVSP